MRRAAGLAVMVVSPSVAKTCPSPLGWDEPPLARPNRGNRHARGACDRFVNAA